jgi:hypothetical protein
MLLAGKGRVANVRREAGWQLELHAVQPRVRQDSQVLLGAQAHGRLGPGQHRLLPPEHTHHSAKQPTNLPTATTIPVALLLPSRVPG